MKRNKEKRGAPANTFNVNMPVVDVAPPAEEPQPAEEPKRRQLIVVDLETTGLHDDAAILEVAAVNLDTGATLSFVPHVSAEALSNAQPEALKLNRYYERGVFEQALTSNQTSDKYRELRDMLRGNVFAGSNPTFDSGLLARVKVQREMPAWTFALNPPVAVPDDYVTPFGRVWHHRLADLAVYAAGKLDIDLDDLPGLDAVAERMGVPVIVERHTALGDAALTATLFEILRSMGAGAGWTAQGHLLADLDVLRAKLWAR
ncbi:DnaQ-like DNA polymerase III subunit [Mycobacterium phage SoSeph]|nr:hypothetical protein SEA_WATERFOUL_54 [Mycobacterium phage Waterfoul]QXN73796.1 DnaQ-like DNA polymerase III subunit [Mycobacterium phage SoSeph]WNM65523.1 DnaQ-like DNA polymerase III subunit [Mycobacterium phage Heftyboy]